MDPEKDKLCRMQLEAMLGTLEKVNSAKPTISHALDPIKDQPCRMLLEAVCQEKPSILGMRFRPSGCIPFLSDVSF
jgi:hypothetical protein